MLLGLLFWFSLDLGYQQAITEQYTHAPIYLQMSVNAENEWLRFYGEYTNEMDSDTLVNYIPHLNTYTLGVSARLGNHLSVEIERSCTHPVVPWGKDIEKHDAGYISFGLRFESR